MNWIYRNDSISPIIYRSETWLPNETRESPFPVPDTLGLTCIQEGDSPDPVLFHDDIIIQAGETATVNINAPLFSHKVALSIFCMTTDASCECRFNSLKNCAIPLDVRGFEHTTAWENCSRIFLINTSDNEAQISISAVEVD